MKALQFNISTTRFAAIKLLKPIFGTGLFFKGPLKTVKLVEIPEPDCPAGKWVKIKTILCGFCGSDLNLMRLHDSPTASSFTSFPCIMGHEIVGRIVEKGKDVRRFDIGDIVTMDPSLGCEQRGMRPLCKSCAAGRTSNCENAAEGCLPPGMFIGINSMVNGGFAPFLTAHESQLFKVPKGLSMAAAVMTEPVSVALQTVFENLPEPSDSVLVVGCGVIGNLVVQAIRSLCPGVEISLVEPADHAAELAISLGADHLVPLKKLYESAAKITGAKVYKPLIDSPILMGGFNRIYDTVGSSSTLNASLRMLCTFGTLSVVGIGKAVKLDLSPAWLKLQTIKGVFGYGRVFHNGHERHVFELALDLMQSGKINADALITHSFELENYLEMISVNMEKARHRAIKTLVAFE